MRILTFEKWYADGMRKEFRKQFEIPVNAASVEDAIEQFDAACTRPRDIPAVERDVRELGV